MEHFLLLERKKRNRHTSTVDQKTGWTRRAELSHLRQLQRLSVLFQDRLAQKGVFWLAESRVGRDQGEGVLAGHLQDGVIGNEAAEAEFAQAVLPGTEKFAQAA